MLRRFIAAALVVLGLAGGGILVAETPAPALSSNIALILNSGCPGGAGVDLNFAAGTSCGPISLTVSRSGTANMDDLAGNWFAVSANTLRQSNKGALIEESRTNSIRNNSNQGAVVGVIGSGGALPTNWVVTALSQQVVGVGVENGIDYIDLRLFGTTAGTSMGIRPEGTGIAIATLSQLWTGSIYIRVVGGTTTNISALGASVQGLTAGQALTTDNVSINDLTGIAASTSLGSFRTAKTLTVADATTAFTRAQINVAFSSGVPVDITLRIGWPQLELGAFQTSPIRTINAAVTRAPDIISGPIAVGSAFSMYFEGVVPPINSTATKSVGGLTDGLVGANSVWPYFSTTVTNFVTVRVVNATVGVDSGPAIGQSVGDPFKTAFAFRDGDSQGAYNGSLKTPGTQAMPPGLNTLSVGNIFARYLDGYLRRLSVWPNTRLPNGTLTSMTLPYLLKRDLPGAAANDNTPAFLNAAA